MALRCCSHCHLQQVLNRFHMVRSQASRDCQCVRQTTVLEPKGAKAIAEALKMFKSSTPGSTCVSPCVEPGAEPLNTFRAFGDGLGALGSDTAVCPTQSRGACHRTMWKQSKPAECGDVSNSGEALTAKIDCGCSVSPLNVNNLKRANGLSSEQRCCV